MMEEETQLSPGSSDEHQSPQENQQNTRKKRNKNKRRFSNEQVKSLETIFESETKLEPRKKMQVARELGLQPRQVAIWFQNKRARWKSKQTEKNYRVLKANYEGLRVRFEALKEEKESLLEQLQQLNELLEKTHQGSSTSKDFTTNSPEKGRSNEENIGSFKEEPSGLQEDIDRQRVLYSDDENIAYLDQDEPELLQISENIDGSLASPVKWCSFEAGSLFDQSSSSSQWWDSWT